jgi:diguanylate cyclase (GGDEF)-like protein
MSKTVDLTTGDAAVVAALTEENRTLWAAVESMRAQLAELELLADTDTLTPILNRRAFLRELECAIQILSRHGVSAAVLFIDINHLKSINDTHGHQAGDAAILHVARLLREHVRVSDTVARIGGDEFGIILTHLDEPSAQAKATALIAQVNTAPFHWDGAEAPLSVGCGLAIVRPDDCIRTVMARSDAAMYAARRVQRSLK